MKLKNEIFRSFFIKFLCPINFYIISSSANFPKINKYLLL